MPQDPNELCPYCKVALVPVPDDMTIIMVCPICQWGDLPDPPEQTGE